MGSENDADGWSGDTNFEEIRQRYVRSHLIDGDDSYEGPMNRSLHFRILNDLTIEAKKYAEREELNRHDFEEKALEPACDVIWSLQSGLVDHTEGNKEARSNFWKHEIFPIQIVKEKKAPYIMRAEIENAASRYLDLPFRSTTLDRLLVDVLIAMEVYAYCDQMINEFTIPGIPRSSPLKQPHALWRLVRGQIINALILIGGVAAAIYAGIAGWLNDEWAIGIILVLIVIFAIMLILALIATPILWKTQSAAKKKTLELMDAMVGVYAELGSGGYVSAKHVRARAEAVTDIGAVWPGPLFVLLDDIIERTGRL